MSAPAPLAGITVVEFTHMVMGPTVGHILAGLGAEVVRVEPIGGDQTRRLLGSGAGYFPMYNRGKQSICLDLKSEAGLAVARDLIAAADVLVENFRPGALDRLGLGYEACAAANPRLIYCSEKGFLPGPYENRTALDEVAQMMGGQTDCLKVMPTKRRTSHTCANLVMCSGASSSHCHLLTVIFSLSSSRCHILTVIFSLSFGQLYSE